MDYNYVRMRNAEKEGDDALAMHYRRLYEKGIDIVREPKWLNYAIILLSVAAALLGVYIIVTGGIGGAAA